MNKTRDAIIKIALLGAAGMVVGFILKQYAVI